MRAAILTRTWFGLSAGSAAAVGILLYPERKIIFFILYFICYLFVLICMVFVLSRIKL